MPVPRVVPSYLASQAAVGVQVRVAARKREAPAAPAEAR